MATEMRIHISTWSDYSGEFGDTAFPIRRVRYAGGNDHGTLYVRIMRLWRVDWWNPEDCGESWEWGPEWIRYR